MNSNCKKLYKLIFILPFLLFSAVNTDFNSLYAAVNAPVKPAASLPNSAFVSPVTVVNCPQQYLNKTITFEADFISYSALGLDYKPAFRDSAKYIGVLIKRDDVSDHVIPLSEMKLFIKRETAEKFADLESGDKIKISGTVFSAALGDPWVDITSLSVVKKSDKEDNNSK